jgi:flagellar protein FliT
VKHDDLALVAYESMASKSGAMLIAAKNDDWDEVTRLEHECKSIINRLQGIQHELNLTAAQRDRKARLIRSIIAEDAQIRDLAQPWLADLSQQFCAATGSGNSTTQRAV